jgi:hypothetical protein
VPTIRDDRLRVKKKRYKADGGEAAGQEQHPDHIADQQSVIEFARGIQESDITVSSPTARREKQRSRGT